MKTVVIGGQSRNVGKTSLACSLVSQLADRDWTAVKITQFGHGICAVDGKTCDCAVEDPNHVFALSREKDSSTDTDTSRLLRAGAKQVYWLRVFQGRLADAMPTMLGRLDGEESVLIESNSAVEFVSPDAYVSVVDGAVEDFKASARRLLPEAHAFAVSGGHEPTELATLATPRFFVEPPRYCTPELTAFVRERLES